MKPQKIASYSMLILWPMNSNRAISVTARLYAVLSVGRINEQLQKQVSFSKLVETKTELKGQ